MRILGGSASRPSPRTSLFATRSFPAREGDHGPREEPIELSSGGEADHRGPPVLRSDRFAQTDGLSRAARLELGVLRGLLLSELSEIDDQRLPRAFPFYFLYRLSIVNYLLRE